MSPKEHFESTLILFNSTINEMKRMGDFLASKKINDQFYRRLFLRNLFSIIETYVFVSKELVKSKLIIDNNTQNFSWLDLAALNEKKVVLNEKGEPKAKDDFQSFEPSLRFAFNIFAKVFNADPPDYGDNNFEKLRILYKRRNDITHPKSLQKLIITDQEIKDSISMFGWFMHTHAKINERFLDWVRLTYGETK